MFGFGRKDRQGRQVRLEHRGRNLRASRTGGVAVRAGGKAGPVNATVNSAHGLRLSTRLAKGTQIALQRGRFRLQGRWNAGPLGFNLSKSGVSASLRTPTGTFNFLKPRYSSFKFAGVQVRGKNAVYLHTMMGAITVAVVVSVLAIKLVIVAGWLCYLVVAFVWDLARGFFNGARADAGTAPGSPHGSAPPVPRKPSSDASVPDLTSQ
jgi:hypothetical protein